MSQISRSSIGKLSVTKPGTYISDIFFFLDKIDTILINRAVSKTMLFEKLLTYNYVTSPLRG